jgi:hypothetical protein
MRKQFFRWSTIERAVKEYQKHLGTDGIWSFICWQALEWKYGKVFHGPGRGRNGKGRGFYRLYEH